MCVSVRVPAYVCVCGCASLPVCMYVCHCVMCVRDVDDELIVVNNVAPEVALLLQPVM